MSKITDLFSEDPAFGGELDLGGFADVNQVLLHHIEELAQECGEEDEYVRYMRSTLTARVLPFPTSEGEQQ